GSDLVTGVQTCALPTWALRSGDLAEATLVAARNLQGRFGTRDDTHKILKSLDERRIHGFGRDGHTRTAIDDAACGSCSYVRRKEIGRASCRERVSMAGS